MKKFNLDFEMEKWQDIIGFEEHYQVSNLGRIKSLSRIVLKKGQTPIKERILKNNPNRNGYLLAALSKNGIIKSRPVHRIVIEAFMGKQNNPVDHINGIRIDNRLLNLRYCTTRQNCVWGCQKVKHSSIFTGVSKNTNGWIARISLNGKSKYLGYFKSEKAASIAYQNALP